LVTYKYSYDEWTFYKFELYHIALTEVEISYQDWNS